YSNCVVLSIIISRFSQLLFFIQKTGRRYVVNLDVRKYLADDNVNLFFYERSERQIWKQIKASIGEQKAKQIKKTIIPLRSAFLTHWRKVSQYLFLWKRYLQNNRSLLRQIVSDVKKLLGIKRFSVSQVPIYLVIDPVSKDKDISAWFSWTANGNFIVVEIPYRLKLPSNLFPVHVLAHEFFHLMLRKNKNLFFKINKIAKDNEALFTKLSIGMPNRIFFEELVISSFIPEGYLSKKHADFKFAAAPVKPKDLLSWRKFVAEKLHPTAKKYINNALPIDAKYLKNLVRIIKQNAK
ncbi:MAG: hypothetical protein V1707_02490, partial [bacterium]